MATSRRCAPSTTRSRCGQPGTASGYTRDPFHEQHHTEDYVRFVDQPVIQAYPLPDTSALANNQTTNRVQAVLGSGRRFEWTSLDSNTTIFGRFSQQDPDFTAIDFRTENHPGSVGTARGTGQLYHLRRHQYLVAHPRMIAGTHVFSPHCCRRTIRIWALQPARAERRRRAGSQFGREAGSEKREPRAFLIWTTHLLALELHGNWRSGLAAHDPAGKHVQSEYQFYQAPWQPLHQVRNQHRAPADHRFPDQSG